MKRKKQIKKMGALFLAGLLILSLPGGDKRKDKLACLFGGCGYGKEKPHVFQRGVSGYGMRLAAE